MTQRYNTGRPVPSSTLPDMSDNLLFVDEYVNKTSGTATSRTGEEVPVLQEQVNARIDGLTEAASNTLAAATEAVASTEQSVILTSQARDEAVFASTNAQNVANANTYFITPDDPDGTLAGLAGTETRKTFRVAQGAGENVSFIYYLNDDGVARAVSSQPGAAAVNNLIPLNDTSIFSTLKNEGKYELAAQYDEVSVDNSDNVLWFIIDGKRVSLVEDEFRKVTTELLIVNGKEIDPDGVLPGDAGNNLMALSETSGFFPAGMKYELNPIVRVDVDEENNILFDLEEYIEKKPLWDEAQQKTLTLDPQKFNPLLAFTDNDSAGTQQVRVYNTETNRETIVTTGGTSKSNVRTEVLDRVVWSEEVAEVPGNLFFAEMPDLTPHSYIARKKLVGWGHSFMENGAMMSRLSSLTGLYAYNFGKSSLRSTAIAARQGGDPYSYMPVDGVIPASGTVELTPTASGPAGSFSNGPLSVPPSVLAGVPGTFTWDGSIATFTRTTDGDAVPVPEPVPLIVRKITTAGVTNGAPSQTEYPQNDECINIFWLGRNNIGATDTIIKNAIGMVSYLKNKGKRIVILPDFPGGGEVTGSTNNLACLNLNAALKATFPEFYCEIDGVDLLQNFMNHHNPDFAGDIEDITNGVTPRSLRYDWLHPSQSISGNSGGSLAPDYALWSGAEVNADFIYKFIKRKGWL